jgi:hypothetical protein
MSFLMVHGNLVGKRLKTLQNKKTTKAHKIR